MFLAVKRVALVFLPEELAYFAMQSAETRNTPDRAYS
jgi:hypothetical protein